jgi:hypothetical protein
MGTRDRVFGGGASAPALLFTTAVLSLVLFVPTGFAATAGEPLGQSTEPPVCQDCHPDEYELWQDSTHASAVSDPRFQAALKGQPNEEACLECHTTGPDSATGEGISCEACHGPYVEGHPDAATMVLPMESETCRSCHRAAFEEWEESTHGSSNIECFDCHLSHSQGLRTGSEETLCAACHEMREMQATHVTHHIDGLECSGCHMQPQTTDPHAGMAMTVEASTHGFAFDAEACMDCHNQVALADTVAMPPAEMGLAAVEEAAASAEEIQTLERRLASLRNVAVAGMGLAFGIGGFLGLVAGLVVMALLRRPHEAVNERNDS